MQEVTLARPDRAKTIIVLLLPVALLLAATWGLIGSFYYTLDDPYIHLQLADMIGNQGHFGLHADSFASPSSSLLWTLWLALWARLPAGYDYVPLLTNIGILALLAHDLLKWLARITSNSTNAIWILLAILLSLNAYWLVLSGMEQLMQAWLAVRVTIAVSRSQWQAPSLYGALLALALLRYESLALCLPVLMLAMAHGEYKKPLCTLGLICLSLAAYSIFLHEGLGLAWLPASVQIKSVFAHVGENAQAGYWLALLDNIRHVMQSEYNRYLLWLLAGWLAAWHSTTGRQLMAIATVVYIAHALFGRADSGRYEIYVIAVCWVASVHNAIGLLERYLDSAARRVIFMLAVVVLNTGSVLASLAAPWAARNIHDQQGQLGILVKDYLRQPVAANDIGLISRHNDLPVLDLVGLGTKGVYELRHASALDSGWITTLLEQHHTHYAMVYEHWFPAWPANLIKVASLDMPGPLLTPAARQVALYADSVATRDILRQAIAQYQHDHPAQAGWFHLTEARRK